MGVSPVEGLLRLPKTQERAQRNGTALPFRHGMMPLALGFPARWFPWVGYLHPLRPREDTGGRVVRERCAGPVRRAREGE
jgi:hypothetical protein